MLCLNSFIDHLIHEVEADDWRSEVDGTVCITPNGHIDMAVLVFDPCLENPELLKWRDAFVWRLIDQFGDDAYVVPKRQIEKVSEN